MADAYDNLPAGPGHPWAVPETGWGCLAGMVALLLGTAAGVWLMTLFAG